MKQQVYYSAGYARRLPPEDRVEKLLAIAGAVTAERFLDIGCGDGSLTVALKNALGATEVFGVEISAQGSLEAREKGVSCYDVNVDESPLPFEDNSMDAVYAGEVLEHLYDPDHLLDEIHRVLHPRGTAIIDTPNLGWWADRLSLLLGYQPMSTESSLRFGGVGKLLGSSCGGGGGHLRILTLRAFQSLLEVHGLNVRKIVGAAGKTTPPSTLPVPLRSLYVNLNRLACSVPSVAQFLIAVTTKSPRVRESR